MTILLHRQALTFINPGKWNAKTQRYEGGGAKLTLSPSNRPQQAPDWIGETDTFKHSEGDGFVMRMKQLSPKAAEKSLQPAEMNRLGFGAPNIESVNLGRNNTPEPAAEIEKSEALKPAEAPDEPAQRGRKAKNAEPVAAE